MKRNVLLAGILLLLLGTANATQITGDFSLETDCSVPAEAEFILHNNIGTAQLYSIRAVGENKEWINLNGIWIGKTPLQVSLEEGDSEELYAFVKPQTCYVEPGNYTIAVEVSNGQTISKEIKIKVLESRSLEINITPRSKRISQCQEGKFEVEITNIGKMRERVTLDVEAPSVMAILSLTELVLDAGETETIKLTVKPACNAETEEHEIKVRASLGGTSFSASKSISLEIDDRQDINIRGEAFEGCGEKTTKGTITVKNNGLLADALRLEVEGLDWAKLEPTTLVLEPGQEEEISITFNKTEEIGDHEFEIKAISSKFGKETTEAMAVEVKNCYNVDIELTSLNGEKAGKKAELCMEEKPVYKFSITNDGLEAMEADLRISGIDSVISPASISLESGESAEITLELDLENQETGEKSFSLQVNGENSSFEEEFELLIFDCYSLNIQWNGLLNPIDLDANYQSELFTIAINNLGSKAQAVTVTSDGPEWVYFEPEQPEIGPGEEREVYFYFSPPYDTAEGDYSSIVSIKGMERDYSRRVEMAVYGGLSADLGTADVGAKAEVEELIETVDRQVKVSLQFSNNGENTLKVLGISSLNQNLSFEFEEKLLQPGQVTNVPAILILGPEDGNQLTVMLQIETDKGVLDREITINLSPKEEAGEEGETGEAEAIPVGLFGLAGVGDLALAAVVIVVIAIFAAIALRAESESKPESGLTHLAKEVQELPGKKLEQIGKHRKQGSKNLHELVKEVKKRPAKKTKKRKK